MVAFVVALWAAYFVPLVLRRYDEASKHASLDVASPTRKVVSAIKRSTAPTPSSVKIAPAAPAVSPSRPLNRESARIAARRRRNTLLTLLALLAIVTALAAGSTIPWLSVAAPAALIVAWLVACRLMVRQELGLAAPKRTRREVPAMDMEDEDVVLDADGFSEDEGEDTERVSWWSRTVARVSAVKPGTPRLTADDEEHTIVVSDQLEEHDPDYRHVMESDSPLASNALEQQLQIAVPSSAVASGETLWDPLPVTVPTYVTKPRAGRTVRTIDFNQPGTWTSGHVEGEQTELSRDASDRDDDAGPQRTAVGH